MNSPEAMTADPGDAALIRARLVELVAECGGQSIEARYTSIQGGSEPSFTARGYDSRELKQLARRIEDSFGVKVTAWQLLEEYPTISLLAEHLARTPPMPAAAGAVIAEDTAASGLGGQRISAEQAAHLAALDARLAQRLARSRQAALQAGTAANAADDGHALSFPLVTARARGAGLRDIDGNDYIDLACDDAQLLFGHVPELVKGAIAEQLERGHTLDQEPDLASAAAMRFMRLSGYPTVRFVASAADGRLAALQVARRQSGRHTVVAFHGGNHGLVEGPTADGPVVLLDYASSSALDWIRQHRNDIAAVLVEAVQRRRAGFHPRSFLRELRAICAAARIAFVLDESITGLRLRDAQRRELHADLAIHGRVIAGGLAIGALAGEARYLALIDDSAVTAASGLHREPLALAAADAVLEYWSDHGSEQINALNQRTDTLAAGLNALFGGLGLRCRVEVFGSLFHLDLAGEPLAHLLHVHLRLRGVHLLPDAPGCLSTVHSDEDVQQVIAACRDSLDELCAAGVLTARAELPQPEAPEAAAAEPTEAAADSAAAEAEPPAEPLSEAMREQILVGFNRTDSDFPREHCLQQLVEARAWASPDAIAVSCGTETLSYRSLNEQATRLANLLRSKAPSEGPVAVQIEPSCARLIGLLAVLKAGRAWLGLDSHQPLALRRQQLADAGVSALLTDDPAARLELADSTPVIDLIRHAAQIAASPASRPQVPPNAEAAAWLLAARPTPAGAAGEQTAFIATSHRALVNLLMAISREPAFYRDDLLYAHASLASALAVIELFLPLVVGARVVLGEPVEALDGPRLRDRLQACKATALIANPDTILELLEAGFRATGSFRLLCNGPRLDRALADRVLGAGGMQLWQLHGAPEAAVWSLRERVPQMDEPVSLGLPIANSRAYVLDEQQQPVAIGEAGLLHLGGVALELPDAASEALCIANPFGSGRLLRTDDLVRHAPDGRLQWLGKLRLPMALGHEPAASAATGPIGIEDFEIGAAPAPPAAPVPEAAGGAEPVASMPEPVVLVEAEPEPAAPEPPPLIVAPPPARARPPLRSVAEPAPIPEPPAPLRKPEPVAIAALPPAPPVVTTPEQPTPAPALPPEPVPPPAPEPVLATAAEPEPEPPPTFDGTPELDAYIAAGLRSAPMVAAVPTPAGATEQPCSFEQETLWLLDRLEPGSAALTRSVRWTINGEVDSAVMTAAWRYLIDRHAVLRTLFVDQGGQPRQQLRAQAVFALSEIDLGALPAEGRREAADRIASIEARTPFDLDSGPLLRVTLLRETPTGSTLLVCLHPIIADRESLSLLVCELGSVYRSLQRGTEPALPELPRSYVDYARARRAEAAAAERDVDVRYWRQQLTGATPLRLAADRPEPLLPTTRAETQTLPLPRDVIEALQAVAERCGARLHEVMLAGLAALLQRLGGGDDLLIAGRHINRGGDYAQVIGPFEMPLLLRLALKDNPGVLQLVTRLRDTVQAAIAHSRLPIEAQLALLQQPATAQGRSRLPLAFSFEPPLPCPKMGVAGDERPLDLREDSARQHGAIHDLEFLFGSGAHGWELACRYRTDVHTPASVARLLANLRAVLVEIAGQPAQRISDLDPIAADERERLLASPVVRASPGSFLDVFQRFIIQVGQRPEACAVICNEHSLSYRQLEIESARLASLLHGRISNLDRARIGFCLPRGVDLPIVMMALARVGASWVAIDPGEPVSRLTQIIESAGLSALIVRGRKGPTLPAGLVGMIDLDAEAALLARIETPHKDLPQLAQREACVCFGTAIADAGSALTGYRLNHATLITRLMALADKPGLRGGDALLATTPVHLEAALLELLLPLVVGARIVLASETERGDGRRLQRLLLAQRQGSVVLHAPPPLFWRLLIGGGWGGHPPLRVWYHGEAADPDLNARLLSLGCELWRLHAVPGSTICAGMHRIYRPDDNTVISEALPGVVTRVLGPQLQLLPIGASGELYLGGSAIAPSLVDPEDYDERYQGPGIADPHSTTSGARLQATGDRVRLRGAQTIELIGRSDRSVQIEGQRIDPAAIEALLRKNPNVFDAAVRVAADESPGAQISAWVTVAAGPGNREGTLAELLRKMLAATLPAALLPSVIHVVDSLPRRAAHEVDFAELERLTAPQNLLPPAAASETQTRLAAIWTELLGIADIEPEASFFALGGHSLLAARLLGRIERSFKRRATLATLHEAPSLHALALWLDRSDGRDFDFRQIVKLQALGGRPPIIAINNTGLYPLLSRRLGNTQPFTALQLFDPALPREELPKTLEEAAAAYVQLIRRVHPQGLKLLLGDAESGALCFEVGRQLLAEDGIAPQLVLLDAEAPRQLEQLSKLRQLAVRGSLRLQSHPLMGRRGKVASKRLPAPKLQAESHDQWLHSHLERLTAQYQPRAFDGHILLLRARDTPSPWWSDATAGWAVHASKGVTVERIDGNRVQLLQDPVVSDVAEQIARRVETLLGLA